MEKFIVYIIYSKSYNIYYKGFTTNILQRLEFHNLNQSKYTSGKGPWRLMYQEEFRTKSEALKREKQLKKQNRKYLEWLIDGATKTERNLGSAETKLSY